MKLLICTQKVDMNDQILGFFHNWIKEFSKHCSEVTVICLEKGEYQLPQNVHVLSLGKELKYSRISYLLHFYHYIWHHRKEYDVVFVHMNPIYLVLAGWYWKLLCKKVALWYTHKHVDFKLRIAELWSDIVFSASKESFKLPSKKLMIMGHGIDTDIFKPLPHTNTDVFTMITVGRISRIKNYEYCIDALTQLKKEGKSIQLDIIGLPVTQDDEIYFNTLKETIKKEGIMGVNFLGAIPNTHIPEYIAKAQVFINMSETGSMDKAVLEAMACGVPVLTSNNAFKTMLSPYNLFIEKDAESIVKGVQMIYDNHEQKPGGILREIVVKDHNLPNLITRIIKVLTTQTQ